MMNERKNKLDQVKAWIAHARPHLRYVLEHTASQRVDRFAKDVEFAAWQSCDLCRSAIRDLETTCLQKSAPLEYAAAHYSHLRNQLVDFRKEYLDLYQIIPTWEGVALTSQEPGVGALPDDFRHRLATGAINATQAIDHALNIYRDIVESANGFEIAPRPRPACRPLRHNTIREVAGGLARIRRDLPMLERDIAVDLARLSYVGDIREDARKFASEARALTRRAHRFHLDLVKHMDDWMLSSGPLAFDQSGYLRLRQRQFDFKDMIRRVCTYYGYTRMKCGTEPRPQLGLNKRLWRNVDLAKQSVASSLNACEELVMAATGLPVKPQLWRNDHE